DPVTIPTPLIINGAITTIKSFIIKFTALFNIHLIIDIAEKGIPAVETLLNKSKDDIIINYRLGNNHVNK
ncbi:hypothetical protein BKA61DRAFT_479653, partial [Leptodontidium sp. MPI-SDFR-AT-0119]